MFRQIHKNPDIYTIPVVLPNNPLKNLNCYIIKTPEENLVIDTGFNQPECLEALSEGLKELKIDMDRTTLFLTHLHSDHIGLTNHIATKKTRILISSVDYDYLKNQHGADFWTWMEEKFYREGLSRELIELARYVNPARAYAPEYLFDAETVSDNDTFHIGDYAFRCLWTPGHTRDTPVSIWKRKDFILRRSHFI